MRYQSCYDIGFSRYGVVHKEYDCTALCRELAKKPVPEEGIFYIPSDETLEALPIYNELKSRCFGDMPIEIGYVAGKNDRLNCLEYHKSSELNIPLEDIILLLGWRGDIEEGHYDTSRCEAFLVPAGTCLEIFGTTLHYAPVETTPAGYRMACVLPLGTNTPASAVCGTAEAEAPEERWLQAKNKWIAALPEAPEAAQGVYPGLTGKNICLSDIER